MESSYSLSLCSITFFNLFSKSLRENMIIAPQPMHFTLMSAPILTISHCAYDVVHVLGTFDGIEFNYQIMRLFDLIRIRYYTKYFI